MTMIRHRRISPRIAAWLLFLFVLCLVAIFFRAPLAGAFWRVLTPLIGARTAAEDAGGGLIALFRSKIGLEAENRTLRDQLSAAQAALADRDALVIENYELKKLMGRTDVPRVTLGRVVMRPPAIPYDTLIIDIGTDNGISPGDMVSAGGGSVVGTISDTYASSARVVLFSSPGSEYSGMLRGEIPVTIIGDGGGSLSARVPASTKVSIDDSVTLSGPAAALAARVSYVDAPQGDSFKTIYLHLPVNASALNYVSVWRSAP